jgi:tellurite methyltransferase
VPGLALDLAMGKGANAGYLASLDWRVIGVDISDVAVFSARKNFPAIFPVLADLSNLRFPDHSFDLILNLYYLNRDWLSDFSRILKPGGMLIIETLTVDMLYQDPNITRSHLLARGELHQQFACFDILYKNEGWIESDHGSKKSVSSLIARKPR